MSLRLPAGLSDIGDEVLTQRLLSSEGSEDKQSLLGRGSLGTFTGVFIPTLENMLGVVVFLRFASIVGKVGYFDCLRGLGLCTAAALTTTACLSAIAASGGPASDGGPYFMISRALGPHVGASVGLVYWLGIVLLGVMESLGAAEILSLIITDCPDKTTLAICMISLLTAVTWSGVESVSRVGIVFFAVVVFSVTGLVVWLSSQAVDVSPSLLYFLENLKDHGDGSSTVLGLLFTCFSGIFSGADRAESLADSTTSIS